MGMFKSQRSFPYVVEDLAPVAADVAAYFQKAGYETQVEPTLSGQVISLSKGGTFKAVLGLKTALNVEIERLGGQVYARASVGIFGAQAIPTFIMLFITWPVLVTQIWGLVRQSKLDDEALQCVEDSLRLRSGQRGASGVPPAMAVRNLSAAGPETNPSYGYCAQCGHPIMSGAKFCAGCGEVVAVPG